MKKEEMITTMNERFSNMTEEGVQALFNIIMSIPERERWLLTTTPERLAELDALAKQKEQEEAQKKEEEHQECVQYREQFITEHAKLFDAINSVSVPTRYDIGNEDVAAIDFVHGKMLKMFPETFGAYMDFFKYGFLKGMRYATNEMKRKK